jgi:hypothetical protein
MRPPLLLELLQCGATWEAHIYDVVSSTPSAWDRTCRGDGLHYLHFCA